MGSTVSQNPCSLQRLAGPPADSKAETTSESSAGWALRSSAERGGTRWEWCRQYARRSMPSKSGARYSSKRGRMRVLSPMEGEGKMGLKEKEGTLKRGWRVVGF